MADTYMDWLLKRSAPTPSQGPLLDLNQMPSPDSMAGQMPGELSSYEPGMAETYGPAIGAFAKETATMAPEAMLEAYDNPTLGNVADAGAKTALTFFQPGKAVGIAGGALGLGGLQDLFGGSSADAAEDPLTPDQQKRERTLSRIKYPNPAQKSELEELRALRRSAAEIAAKAQAEAATAGTRLQAETEAEKRRMEMKQYDDQVTRAKTERDKAMGRDMRFSDSSIGQVYNDLGGVLPYLGAYSGGVLSRLGTGPGKKGMDKFMKDYALPTLAGTGLSFGAMSAPLFGDMIAPAANPEREAEMKYGYNLPDGHPDKQKAMEYAKSLPEQNPVQKEAYDTFQETLLPRLGAAAAEGFSLGKAGALSVAAGERGVKALKGPRPRKPPTPPAQPALPGQQPATRQDLDDMFQRLSQGKPPTKAKAKAQPAVTRTRKAKSAAPAQAQPTITGTGYSEVLRQQLEKLKPQP